MGTVGRVKNQHPGDASVHGRYHVDLVSQCGLFCSTTGCSTSITQKDWLKTVSPERLYAAAGCFLTGLVTPWVLLLVEGICEAGCSSQTGCWELCLRFDKSPGSTQATSVLVCKICSLPV